MRRRLNLFSPKPRFMGRAIYLYEPDKRHFEFSLPAVCQHCGEKLTKLNSAPIFNNRPLCCPADEKASDLVTLCKNCYANYEEPPPLPKPLLNSIVLNGPLVIEHRHRLMLSQAALARAANISLGTLRRVERRGRPPYFVTERTARRLAKALGLGCDTITVTPHEHPRQLKVELEKAQIPHADCNRRKADRPMPRVRRRCAELTTAQSTSLE